MAEQGKRKTLVVVPTYNEKDNVRGIIDLILRQVSDLDVLVVDDNSPDGTAKIVEEIARQNPRVHLLRRAGKLGLGTAYLEGFKWGLARDYDFFLEIDADLSHDPKEIPNFLQKIQDADLVLGSRYLNGIRVLNWPFRRLMLSKGAALYVRLITGMPMTDPTGGFKCFRRQVLEGIKLDNVCSNGYAFQIEMTYKAWISGFRVCEIPITFTERRDGRSKMSGDIVGEALRVVWVLAVSHYFRRLPAKPMRKQQLSRSATKERRPQTPFREFDQTRLGSAGQWPKLTFLIVLISASVGVSLPGLFSRAIWYDESVTLLEMAGHTVPAWPAVPAPAHLAKSQFQGASSLKQITQDLGYYDSHPPLYYWSVSLWRRCWGSSLNVTRAFSLLCSVATTLALYGLLCAANFEVPFIPTLIYAFSTGSVHFGQEARSYALITLLIALAALCAYLATEAQIRWRTYSIATGLFCGAAFATHYLALFPACVILAWLLVNLRSRSWRIAMVTILVACSVAGLGLLTLLNQSKTSSIAAGGYLSGYYGVLRDAVAIGQMDVNLLWIPSVQIFTGTPSRLARGLMYAGWAVLLGFGVVLLIRRSLEGRRRFWLLVLGLALAPSAGLMLLDFLWKRHLYNDRYLTCAGPALAVIAAYGVAKLASYRPKSGWCLAAGVLLIQLTGINWGKEKDSGMGLHPRGSLAKTQFPAGLRLEGMRSLAKTIEASPASSRVVVIGEDKPGWYPAALIYELAPEVVIVTLGSHQDLDRLYGLIEKYDYIWFVPCGDATIVPVEAEFFSHLLRSDLYTLVSSYPPSGDPHAVLLRRPGTAPK